MIRVVTFDLDDTLWDVRPALIKAEGAQNDWLNQHYPQALADLDSAALLARKRALLKAQPALAHNISRFRQTYLEQLLLDAGVTPAEAQAAAQEAFAVFLSRRNDVAVFEQAEPVLKALSNRYVLGALTNGNADVRKTPLGGYFSFALKAEDVGAAKPETALFEAALDHSNVAREAMVHIGDSHDHDIVGAERAGVKSIWLTNNAHADHRASEVIGCLSELPEMLDRMSAAAASSR